MPVYEYPKGKAYQNPIRKSRQNPVNKTVQKMQNVWKLFTRLFNKTANSSLYLKTQHNT